MNKNKLGLLLFVLCLGAFAACHKNNNSSHSSGSMKAMINGTDTFSTSDVTVNLSAAGYLTIDGKENDKHVFISVYNYNNGVGTFILGSSLNPAYYAMYDTLRFAADTGQLVLVSTGPNSSSGTFNFVCHDSTVVKNGILNINY